MLEVGKEAKLVLDLDLLEKRARNAVHGYPSDVNINCYVYGRDVLALVQQVKKLQAFKDWVHKYLDERGVPHHPPGPHGAEGCRIGDRMDWLMAEMERLKQAAIPTVGVSDVQRKGS